MSQIEVYVDTSEVLHALSDADLLSEVQGRKLGSLEGERKEDLARAVAARNWPEVDYLLRTYFLKRELEVVVTPARLRAVA